jgi:hypothetical protein
MAEIPVEMPIDDFRPTVADVAALLRARTKDVNGNEIGTFNDDTRPTSAQVVNLIETACGEIQSAMGVSPPAYLAEAARTVAAVRTAMLIELSYFPEQVRSDRSAYQYYADMFETQMTALTGAASGAAPGGNRVFSVAIPVPGLDPVIPLEVSAMAAAVALEADPAQVGEVVGAAIGHPDDVIGGHGPATATDPADRIAGEDVGDPPRPRPPG